MSEYLIICPATGVTLKKITSDVRPSPEKCPHDGVNQKDIEGKTGVEREHAVRLILEGHDTEVLEFMPRTSNYS